MPDMMARFAGKVAVITGGSRGIGRAIAERFVREGASVCVAANDPLVHETATAMADAAAGGAKVIGAVVDVTDRAQVQALYARVAAELGEVDISVQNAGIITIAKLEDLTEAEWDKVMAVNTKGVFLCCQEAATRMRAGGRKGRLINTASGQARQGFVYTPHYAASKFGVVGITQSLAKELARTGITVNAFCPGIITTDMWAYNDAAWGTLLGDYRPGELMAEWVEGIPMGRAGTGEDAAGLVGFLASDDAAYITGQTIMPKGVSPRDALIRHVHLLVEEYAGWSGRIVSQILAEGQGDPDVLREFLRPPVGGSEEVQTRGSVFEESKMGFG